MKLRLNKEWFENRIRPNEDFEVGVGVPTEAPECADEKSGLSPSRKDTENAAPRVAPSRAGKDRPS